MSKIHSLVRSKKRLERTIDKYNELNIPHKRTFKNEIDREDSQPSFYF